MGMPVVVVRADAHHRDRRRDGRQERGVGRGRTVVRNDQQLGVQPVPHRAQQSALPGPFDVPAEQHPPTGVVKAQHEGALVDLPVRVAVGAPRRRVQHLDHQVPDHGDLPGRRRAHGHALLGGEPSQLVGVGHLGRERLEPDGVDLQPADHL